MPRPSKAAANGSFANEGQGQSHPVGGPTVNGVAPSLLDTKFAFALVTQLRSKPDVDWDQIGSIMGISKKSKSFSFLSIGCFYFVNLSSSFSFDLPTHCERAGAALRITCPEVG